MHLPLRPIGGAGMRLPSRFSTELLPSRPRQPLAGSSVELSSLRIKRD